MNTKAILTCAEKKSEWIRTSLREMVLQESPSEDRTAVNAAMALAEDLSRSLGGRSKRQPVLLLAHLDTVWPMGTLAKMPWREEKGRYWGPGVLDMKAGVVMALAAVSILRELKLERPVILLLNSEEEVGSTVSRPITEKLALESTAVFVLEPAQGLAYKTARKGV